MRCLISPNIGRLMHQKFSFLVDLVVPVEANLIFLENNLIDLSFSILFRASSQTKSSKMLVETEDGKRFIRLRSGGCSHSFPFASTTSHEIKTYVVYLEKILSHLKCLQVIFFFKFKWLKLFMVEAINLILHASCKLDKIKFV